MFTLLHTACRETLDELSCELYSERNTEYQSVDYAAIEKEHERRSRVSLKVPPYAFTTINTNGSAQITEKPVRISDEECLYDNPDENTAKKKQQQEDRSSHSQLCPTPEMDVMYDNPITVEKVNHVDEVPDQYSTIDEEKVTSNGKTQEADQVTETTAVELEEMQIPYLYSAVDKTTKSIHSDDEL